jgi:hypothetical protein
MIFLFLAARFPQKPIQPFNLCVQPRYLGTTFLMRQPCGFVPLFPFLNMSRQSSNIGAQFMDFITATMRDVLTHDLTSTRLVSSIFQQLSDLHRSLFAQRSYFSNKGLQHNGFHIHVFGLL